MNRNTGMNAGQIIGTMNGQQVIGLDIAKHVFVRPESRLCLCFTGGIPG